MKMGIILRAKYGRNDPRWPWRLTFFRETVLPRLLAQTDQDFDLWIRCNAWHADALRKLDPKIKVFGDRVPPNRYHIQTRTDTDDWLEPGYVAKIKEVVRAENHGQPLLVSFQPWKYDLKTGQVYRVRRRFGLDDPSMFLSLYQPKPSKQIYHTRHNWMHKLFPRVFSIPEGYCYLVIHDTNDQSKIHGGDEPVDIYLNPGIKGWMNEASLQWLYRQAQNRQTIVEIGSYCGRSTHALLCGCRSGQVIAVDSWKGKGPQGREWQDGYEIFKANVGHFPNLQVMHMASLEAAKQFQPQTVDMVFIDANHEYEFVRADIAAWLPIVKPGGLLCGHDYSPTFPGVLRAVDEAFPQVQVAPGTTIWWVTA